MPDAPHMRYEAQIEYVMMVVYMVVLVGAVFSGMMLMFVHMYYETPLLWNALVYSENPLLFTHWTKKCGILLFRVF